MHILLKNSGYDVKFRTEVLKSGLLGYNKILEAEKSGVRPLYRLKFWKATERKQKKQEKKKNWLGPFWKSCIFIPPTPGSKLKNRCNRWKSSLGLEGGKTGPSRLLRRLAKPSSKPWLIQIPSTAMLAQTRSVYPAKIQRTK